ncbi:unnamed protein product [Linum trigynum]|uniref:Retrotransposon gag domain-containing protein n=1 Tax=Linum trigynum TaxID=586398 RepID=A0AAV2E798_9ROSI
MHDRFVPDYYQRELHATLQGLRQRYCPVEDYYRELELLMMTADIREDREATIARFLHGLNREIRQEVELRSFVDLEEVLHLAIKVEKQLKVVTARRFPPANKTTPDTAPSSDSMSLRTEADNPTFPRNQQPKTEGSSASIQCFICFGHRHKSH